MGNFDKRGGGGGRFGGSRGGGSRFGSSGPVSMHQATCSDCGNRCEVPFRPTGEKPVYCNDCFAKKGGRDSRGDRGGDRGPRRDFGGDRGSARPSFGGGDDKIAEIKKKLESLDVKLDKLIGSLETHAQPKKAETKVSAPAKKEVKKVVAKVVAKVATKKKAKK